MQSVYKPGVCTFDKVKNQLQGSKSGCSLFIKVSGSISRELSAWVEPLYKVLNLPPGYCLQLDFTCSKPILRGLSTRDASCV